MIYITLWAVIGWDMFRKASWYGNMMLVYIVLSSLS